MSSSELDIVIVGGGPVGLYLAGRLLQSGFHCKVLEKRAGIDHHSKSLGIHPVSLDIFDKAGITKSFLEHGLKIKSGVAFWNREKIGEVSFEYCPPPHNYILAIPQWKTEETLEEWLRSLDENCLIREADVKQVNQDRTRVEIDYLKNGVTNKITASYVIGCDGIQSNTRKSAQIPFEGSSYPDTYIMGDFDDNTDFGEKAAVYLHKDGLVESFPLPNGHRRWVVKTDRYVEASIPDLITELVFKRTGFHLSETDHYMLSSFGVKHLLAKSFHKNRILLAGDAAHIVSPIGGQGMNLGWLDAEECLKTLTKLKKQPAKKEFFLNQYTDTQRKIAQQVARRAEMNMHLGRAETKNLFYKTGINMIINSPFNLLLANLFTMRGLGRWPI